MMDIFICEDHPQEAAEYAAIIKGELKTAKDKGRLTYTSADAESLLAYLERHPVKRGLYFLDICIQGSMNGIQLAVKIREMDPLGSIVFITSKSEMSFLTFQYQVEAMDFIVKDQIEELPGRIRRCIHKAAVKYQEAGVLEGKRRFCIKTGGSNHYLEPGDILYIQTSRTAPHKVEICLSNGIESLYGTLKEFESALSDHPSFFRCHQSVLVNREYIRRIEQKEKAIVMENGERLPVSVRYMKKIKLH